MIYISLINSELFGWLEWKKKKFLSKLFGFEKIQEKRSGFKMLSRF